MIFDDLCHGAGDMSWAKAQAKANGENKDSKREERKTGWLNRNCVGCGPSTRPTGSLRNAIATSCALENDTVFALLSRSQLVIGHRASRPSK